MATQRAKQPKPTRQRTRTVSPVAPMEPTGSGDTQDGSAGIERITLTPSANTLRLLLRPEEAAQALGISRATCYTLMARGHLTSIVVGERSRRIPVAALTAYIQAQATRQGAHL